MYDNDTDNADHNDNHHRHNHIIIIPSSTKTRDYIIGDNFVKRERIFTTSSLLRRKLNFHLNTSPVLR